MNAAASARYARQFAAAASAYDNASPDESGDSRDERIAELAQQYAGNDTKRHEAAESLAGEFSGDHYEAIDLALFDLHGIEPSDLLNSPILPRLYALAKVVHARYNDWFLSEARAEVDRQIEEGAEDAAEARMERAA